MGFLVLFLSLWGQVLGVATLDQSLQNRSHVQYYDYPEEINCSPAGLTVRIRNDSFQGMSIRLSIVDDSGEPRDLQSLYHSCSFATIPEANGSLLFITPYNGCFVNVVNNIVSMELRIDGTDESKRIMVIERIPVNCSLPAKLTPVTVQSITEEKQSISVTVSAHVKPDKPSTAPGPVTQAPVRPDQVITAPGPVTQAPVRPDQVITAPGPVTQAPVRPDQVITAPGPVTQAPVKPAKSTVAPGPVTQVHVKSAQPTMAPRLVSQVPVSLAKGTTTVPRPITPAPVKPDEATAAPGPVTQTHVKPDKDMTVPGPVSQAPVKSAKPTTASGPVSQAPVKSAKPTTASGPVSQAPVKSAKPTTASGPVSQAPVKSAKPTTASGPVSQAPVKSAKPTTASGPVSQAPVKSAKPTTASGPVSQAPVKSAKPTTASGPVSQAPVKSAKPTTASGPVSQAPVKLANDATTPGPVTQPAKATTPLGPVTQVPGKPAKNTTAAEPVSEAPVKPVKAATALGPLSLAAVKPAKPMTTPGPVSEMPVKSAGPVTQAPVRPDKVITVPRPIIQVSIRLAKGSMSPGPITQVPVRPAKPTTTPGPDTQVPVKPDKVTTSPGPISRAPLRPDKGTVAPRAIAQGSVKPAKGTTAPRPVTQPHVKPDENKMVPAPVSQAPVKSAKPTTASGPVTPVHVEPAKGTTFPGPVTQAAEKPANTTPLSQGSAEGRTPLCAVRAEDRVCCANSPLSEKACKAKGCCYDPDNKETPCFYGKIAYIDCTSKGLFTIVVPKVATVPSLELDSVILVNSTGSECAPVIRTAEFVVFSFPLNACGSVQTVAGPNITYQVDVASQRRILKGARGSITRHSTFRLHVKCFLSSNRDTSLTLRVNTPSPPSLVIGDGILNLEMRIAKDQSYSAWFADGDYPLVKYLREPVFVEVHLLHRLDANIALVLHDCWATQTPDPHLGQQWSILVNGCPFYGDNYLTQLHVVNATSSVPFPMHHKRFEVKTFQFWNRKTQAFLSGKVYFHCSATVCPSSDMECVTTCNAGKRMIRNSDVRGSIEALSQGLVTLERPVIFTPEESDVADSYQENKPVNDNILLAAAVTFLVLSLITGLAVCWNCKQLHKL